MKLRSRMLILSLAILCAACGSNYVVNSEGDEADANANDGICETTNGDCTLRAALQEANVDNDSDTIVFENVSTITLNSPLPALTTDNISIYGAGEVTLDGGQNQDCTGFPAFDIVASSHHLIQGLTILNFSHGVRIDGSSAVAEDNIIGANANTPDKAAMGNVIGGNCFGIQITGPGAADNQIAGNIIGAQANGSSANPNQTGIAIMDGAHHNLVGSQANIGNAAIDTNSLAAYWPLDESNGDALDAYGANHLSEHNDVASSSNGKVQGARNFEANDADYFEAADSPTFSFGDNDFTISLWVRFESLNDRRPILAKLQNNGDQREWALLYHEPSDRFRLRVSSDGSGPGTSQINADSLGSPSTNTWYHILAFHDSANDQIGIIVNDGPADTAPHSGGVFDGNAPLTLGSWDTGNLYMDGLIDEVQFWKRLLSPQEISDLYNGGAGLALESGKSGRNLISGNAGYGIRLETAEYNQIAGNFIGASASGAAALPNGSSGLYLGESDHNVIGLNANGEGSGNLISANNGHGIAIYGSENNTIAGNTIGATLDGSSALGNGGRGLFLAQSSAFNTIGTNGDGSQDELEGNLISGNGALNFGEGIWLASPENVIAGNRIGTNAAGTAAIPNNGSGITIGAGGQVSDDNNRVGTNGDGLSDDLEANLISGNAGSGISIGSAFNQVSGNLIGTDISGTAALGNSQSGVYLLAAAQDNLIGTDGDGSNDSAERNLIAASGMGGHAGVQIRGSNNVVAGNYIGTDISGLAALPNQQYGVLLVSGASGNLIGTDGDGTADGVEGNLISGNGWVGVRISAANSNRLAGNLIGTDATGAAALPNGAGVNELFGAVDLRDGASSNIIGTNGDGNGDNSEGNLISGNDHSGIVIQGQGSDHNQVAGNYIGLNGSGNAALPNALVGVTIRLGAANNRIGTDDDGTSDAAEANVISGNLRSGISINGASSNVIAGNFIGTNAGGSLMLGNGDHGINIFSGSSPTANNWVGGLTLDTGNLIAFNQFDGVRLSGTSSFPLQNPIVYNSIHSNDGAGINLIGPNSGGEAYGITQNDAGDGDSGSNDLLNFPVLTEALAVNNSLSISGDIIEGLANATFTVQFFGNDQCDLGNHGEGQTYLGETVVNTNGSGNASFLVAINQAVSEGSFITATATNNSNTSEFSECIQVEAGQQLSGEPEATLDSFDPGVLVIPNRNVNCRYYCTTQSDIADTLLEGIEYTPLGYDPATGYMAFEGPSYGQLCFAAPLAGGTQLMELELDGIAIEIDELDDDVIGRYPCPPFPTPTPTEDPDEGSSADPTATPEASTPRATPTAQPQCSDGVDNDGDGLIDYVAPGAAGTAGDRECHSANDDDESR